MNYIIRLANENDLSGLCDSRNNKDLFTKYLKQFAKREVYLAIAEQDTLIFGFGVLKINGTLLPKLSDLYVKEDYRGNGYEAISTPYFKKAIFYNNDGMTYNKTYTRIDLKKLLN